MARASPAIAGLRRTRVGRFAITRRLAQHPRRMHRRERARAVAQRVRHWPRCSISRKSRPSTAARRGRAQADDDVGLAPVPFPARSHWRHARDVPGLRRLVQAMLAALLEAEMLHRVGQIERLARSMPSSSSARRAAGRPARRTAGRSGLPRRRAVRRRSSMRASRGPSPNTVCVAGSPQRAARGSRCAACAQRVEAVARTASRAPARARECAAAAPAARARPSRARAGRRRGSGPAAAALPAGCFQYFCGISCRIIRGLRRAGLKMLRVVGAPQRLRCASSAGASAALRARRRSASASPSQCTLRYGVRMAQRMPAKRRAKNGATRSTMWCSGSNHAMNASSSPGTSRKRTKAFILCVSRRTALASSRRGARRHRWRVRAGARSPLRDAPEHAIEQARAGADRDGRARRRPVDRKSARHARRVRAPAAPQRRSRAGRAAPPCASPCQSTSSGAMPARSAMRAPRAPGVEIPRRIDHRAHAAHAHALSRTDPAWRGCGASCARRRAGSSRRLRGWWSSSVDERQHLLQRHAQPREVGQRAARRGGATAGCARRCACPGPARAAAFRVGAVLRSTGKRSGLRSAQASFGSMSRSSMPSRRVGGRDLVDVESVEAQQPVGLVQAMLAQQRRRLQRQLRRGVGNRAEGRSSTRAAGGSCRTGCRWRARIARSSAPSAPTIICVLCPAGANLGGLSRRGFALPCALPCLLRCASAVRPSRARMPAGFFSGASCVRPVFGRQLDVDAQAVGVAAGRGEQFGRGIGNRLEMDVAGEAWSSRRQRATSTSCSIV